MAKHASSKTSHRARNVVLTIVIVLAVAACACAAIILVWPPFAEATLQTLGIPRIGAAAQSDNASSTSSENASSFADVDDVTPSAEELAAEQELQKRAKQTPLIAQCSGVDLRSSIVPADITGILFHQASYEYALVLDTELPEADYDTVADNRSMFVNHEQSGGEWLDAEVLRVWRETDDTPMDTSIDLGALPGTTILSPVDGTVVLVRNYMLYDELPDVEIHIQPDGRPDLDCVLIHTTDPTVKAGDHVEAGITPVAKVRNIQDFLTDVQLAFFLPEEVGGNHVHIQMNDADYPDYREKKLEGAITVKE